MIALRHFMSRFPCNSSNSVLPSQKLSRDDCTLCKFTDTMQQIFLDKSEFSAIMVSKG